MALSGWYLHMTTCRNRSPYGSNMAMSQQKITSVTICVYLSKSGGIGSGKQGIVSNSMSLMCGVNAFAMLR